MKYICVDRRDVDNRNRHLELNARKQVHTAHIFLNLKDLEFCEYIVILLFTILQ